MCRLILGGSGGQGILVLGKLLANASIIEGLNVTCYPVYGAEMRGGYAFSSLTISDREIASPIIARAEGGVFLAQFAFDYLRSMVLPLGLLVINADLVTVKGQRKKNCFPLRANTLARQLGDERCTNMVAAGFLARRARDLPGRLFPFPGLASLKKALPLVFPGRPAAVSLNGEALAAGFGETAGLPGRAP